MRILSGSLMVATLAVLLASAGLRAADPTPDPAPTPVPTTGTISGKVVDANGNGVANASVKLLAAPAKKKAKGDPAPQAAAAPKKGGPVQETTTDKDGKYSFKDVSAGTFNINVATSDKPALTGMAKKVVVVAGQDTAVPDISVMPKKAKAPKAAN